MPGRLRDIYYAINEIRAHQFGIWRAPHRIALEVFGCKRPIVSGAKSKKPQTTSGPAFGHPIAYHSRMEVR